MLFWLRRGDGFAPIVSPTGLARIERTGTLPYPHTDIEYGLGNYGDVGQYFISGALGGALVPEPAAGSLLLVTLLTFRRRNRAG